VLSQAILGANHWMCVIVILILIIIVVDGVVVININVIVFMFLLHPPHGPPNRKVEVTRFFTLALHGVAGGQASALARLGWGEETPAECICHGECICQASASAMWGWGEADAADAADAAATAATAADAADAAYTRRFGFDPLVFALGAAGGGVGDAHSQETSKKRKLAGPSCAPSYAHVFTGALVWLCVVRRAGVVFRSAVALICFSVCCRCRLNAGGRVTDPVEATAGMKTKKCTNCGVTVTYEEL
jgi:hypothetical protein